MGNAISSKAAGIWRLYYEGFRGMTVGRSLWAIIIIKLLVIFFLFKLFFFPDVLKSNYSTDEQRAGAVRTSLLDDTR